MEETRTTSSATDPTLEGRPRGGDGRAAVLYDSDCNICKTITDALLAWDREGRLRPVPIQSEEGARLLHDLSPGERLASFHLVHPDGRRVSAGPALPELFGLLPGGFVLARALAIAPSVTSAGYEWVARNRTALSRFVPRRLKTRADRRLSERRASEDLRIGEPG